MHKEIVIGKACVVVSALLTWLNCQLGKWSAYNHILSARISIFQHSRAAALHEANGNYQIAAQHHEATVASRQFLTRMRKELEHYR